MASKDIHVLPISWWWEYQEISSPSYFQVYIVTKYSHYAVQQLSWPYPFPLNKVLEHHLHSLPNVFNWSLSSIKCEILALHAKSRVRGWMFSANLEWVIDMYLFFLWQVWKTRTAKKIINSRIKEVGIISPCLSPFHMSQTWLLHSEMR